MKTASQDGPLVLIRNETTTTIETVGAESNAVHDEGMAMTMLPLHHHRRRLLEHHVHPETHDLRAIAKEEPTHLPRPTRNLHHLDALAAATNHAVSAAANTIHTTPMTSTTPHGGLAMTPAEIVMVT